VTSVYVWADLLGGCADGDVLLVDVCDPPPHCMRRTRLGTTQQYVLHDHPRWGLCYVPM
jgi:hypothetical protein